jgi:hypothetical protein
MYCLPVVCAGIDTKPDGPGVDSITVAVDGAFVTASSGNQIFAVKFPASLGRPDAVFSFKSTDINDRLGMALDVKNTGKQETRVYADLNGDTWVRGYVLVQPGKTATLYVFARRLKLSAADAARFPAMHGIPGGKMSLWAGIEEPVVANQVKVFVVAPRQAASIQVANIRPFGSSKAPENADFFPFIDRYGQYKHKDWPGKIHSDADFQTSREREDADLAAHPGPKDLDQYGGWAAGPKLRATGNFRVEKYQGKWWLVDPEGHLFWSNGIDAVGFFLSATNIGGRDRFFENPVEGGNFLIRNLGIKYGTDWRTVVNERNLNRIRSWGLNTMGGGSDQALIQTHRVPYAPTLNSGGRGVAMDPSSDAWVASVRRSLTNAAQNLKDDPWCIGFFVDNEIHTSTDPAWFEAYYKKVSELAKEIMPNKLYFGSRLDYHDYPEESAARKEIVRIAGKYCDVISFNFYKFTLEDVILPQGVDKPIIVGEFHMGALDRGLLHTGLRSVIDQAQRAEGYRLYVTSGLRNPAVVGAHWFQFYDESTTGRFDGENYQIGFLDIGDTPYAETITASREVGYRLYAIRSAK